MGGKITNIYYKGYKYTYHKWITDFNGVEHLAECWRCTDFNYEPYNIVSFSTQTKEEMRKEIDYLLQNRQKYAKQQELLHKGAAEYYEEKKLSNDNYTGD